MKNKNRIVVLITVAVLLIGCSLIVVTVKDSDNAKIDVNTDVSPDVELDSVQLLNLDNGIKK